MSRYANALVVLCCCVAVPLLFIYCCSTKPTVKEPPADRTPESASPPIYRFALNSRGTVLATFGLENCVHVQNSSNDERIATLKLPNKAPSSLVFVGDSAILVGYAFGDVRLWTKAEGRYESRLVGRHEGSVVSCLLSPVGQFAVTASDRGDITLWEIADSWKPKSKVRLKSAVNAVRFSPDGQSVAAACEDGFVYVLGVPDFTQRGKVKAHQQDALDVDYSPDGTTMATAGRDGTIGLWSTAELQNVARISACREFGSYCYGLKRIRFSPDSTRFAVLARMSNSIIVWDLKTRRILGRSRDHIGPVTEIQFRDEHTLLSSGLDGQLRVVAVPAAKAGLP